MHDSDGGSALRGWAAYLRYENSAHYFDLLSAYASIASPCSWASATNPNVEITAAGYSSSPTTTA